MTPKRVFHLLLATFVCLLTDSRAQNKPKADGPVFMKTQSDDYSKEPYVFELIQTKVRFEMDGKGQRELTIRARIQSESAVRELGLLTYPYASSFESLEVVYVRARKPDGSAIETPQSDVQDVDSAVSREAPMYSDAREKHIAVKSLSVGDVLEAQVRWTMHDAIAPGQFWFVDTFFRSGICLKEALQLDLPKAKGAKVQSAEVKPSIEERGDRQIYNFDHANLKKAEDTKIPEWEKNFYGIDPPEVRVSSFQTWEEVGRWYAQLQEAKIAETPEIKAKAEELAKGKTSEEQKTRALYDFVSLQFRYIGVDLGAGRYTPHAAADVLANRYGDCKDKHTLFAALLKSVGVNAYAVLISSRFRVDPKFPSPDLFDHVITAVSKGDSYEFLDTTPEVAPYGLLLATLRDRQALVVFSNGASKLAKTPSEPPFKPYEKVTIDSSIDTEGTLDAKMRIEERGDGEIGLRAAYRATPQNRWDELTQVLVNRMGFAGKSSEVSVGQPEDTAKPFVLSLAYHRTEYPDWKNHQISLPAPFLALAELTDEQKASNKPLPLGSPHVVSYESTVKLPKDYSVRLPDGVARKTEFADFSAQYSMESGGVLHGKIHWETLKREVPGDKRNEYAELAKSVEDTETRYIPIAFPFSNAAIGVSALKEMLSAYPPAAIPQLEKAAEMQPENEMITVALASAYREANRAKDAMSLLEKKLKASPDDAVLNVTAGETEIALGDSDKAMEFFKRGMGNDPDPITLNNVAYAMAEAKLKLDDAESYAKQAAMRLSLDTRELSAAEADRDDFALMLELAKIWDTVGWVEFEKGNFEEAERYLAGAWDLTQDPVAGEHLAETYEKQNKLPQAATVCAMANRTFGNEKVGSKLREQMKRLQKYLPPRSSDPSVALSDMRTVQVPFHPKLSGKSAAAQVVIVFDGENNVDVELKDASSELQNSKRVLAGVKYRQTFPDDTPVKIVRKATLNCTIYSKECVLILMKASEAAYPLN